MRSSLKSNIAAVLAAAGMALAAPAILAQSNTQGAIVGNVVKDSGAEIVIISRDSGLTRSITPDSEGRFAATALPTGRYTVTLKTPGTPDQNVDVVVGVGSNSVVRFDQMMVSEVVVTGERRVAAIDTSTVEANLQITADELAELPVARTETAVALLAPGTTLGDYRFPGTQGGQTAGLASFSGSSVAENAYFVNGFNVTNFRNGLGGSTIPFEAY
ncbi:MAG: carboxypeptidase-like regulatory domain-containing protein, partial [Rubrivivax sp.]|nr:carboxypeptidase-like regulatory domain-containing protein [Rubrivivax sp.]